MRHRRTRCLVLGPCMRLQFEDELTLRDEMQEVLHAGYGVSPGIVAVPPAER